MLQVVAQQKPENPTTTASTVVTYFATLRTTVFEPMLRELGALEATLSGAEKAAVAEYRANVQRFFTSSVAQVQSLV